MAWETPINVSQESYEAVLNNHVSIKRKRSIHSFPDFVDQINNNLSKADNIVITNVNLPPIEKRPCIMLSILGFGIEEQRVCYVFSSIFIFITNAFSSILDGFTTWWHNC